LNTVFRQPARIWQHRQVRSHAVAQFDLVRFARPPAVAVILATAEDRREHAVFYAKHGRLMHGAPLSAPVTINVPPFEACDFVERGWFVAAIDVSAFFCVHSQRH
jgi:hypothetical protein